MKILVVDDEPQICRLLKTGLTGYGFEVITATSGSEALLLAAQKKLDVIILDVTLGQCS